MKTKLENKIKEAIMIGWVNGYLYTSNESNKPREVTIADHVLDKCDEQVEKIYKEFFNKLKKEIEND